ncbi:hypothetical protein RRG08_041977 [Elysia crispata]|uniref:Uncharacterized protein n=1 Tax=Elysia crispata TaxID=231223 RepID=A0AAE0Z054_9GAST|nr:hypothetical protein RRG08_041977 [Elysia crispata]
MDSSFFQIQAETERSWGGESPRHTEDRPAPADYNWYNWTRPGVRSAAIAPAIDPVIRLGEVINATSNSARDALYTGLSFKRRESISGRETGEAGRCL